MSESNSFVILGPDETDKPAKKIMKNMARRKLGDISNLPHNPRTLIQDGKSQSIPKTANEYIEELRKEKVVLVKMLAQRNLLIEQSGIELERLKLNMIKLQEQNQQLALTHTHMLAELNSSKDQLKTLQHEVSCKAVLLRSRKPDTKENAAIGSHCDEDAELMDRGESKEVELKEKPRPKNRRLRSRSLCSSASLQSDGNDVVRSVLRRRSARFEAVESKDNHEKHSAAEVPEIPFSNEQEVNQPICDRDDSKPHSRKRSQASQTSAIELQGESKRPLTRRSSEVEEEDSLKRSLVSRRPSRGAAKKIQSYKETPLNVKMRRYE